MSRNPRQTSRRRRPVQVEPLEGRLLLSAVRASAHSYPGVETGLEISTSGPYVNQEAGHFAVTLSLKELVALAGGKEPDAVLDQPVTVDFGASVLSPGEAAGGEDPPTASPVFAPFSESVTFPAGVSTETVTVPVVSSEAASDASRIGLSATATSSPVVVANGSQQVTLFSSPDAVPPMITSVQPVMTGKLASAVVVGFSKPMARATVENIQNYRVLSRPHNSSHTTPFFGLFGGGVGTYTTEYQSFPIAAATYDPSASSVTLTLKRPVKASSLYAISSPSRVGGHELTDANGQPLGQVPGFGAAFTVAVHPAPGTTPLYPVGPLKVVSHGAL